MKIRPCIKNPLLEACNLDAFAHQLDTYVGCEHRCCYCYALNRAETDWTREILIHEELVSRLTEELARISPQAVYIGWNSDPYQPAEESHGQTRRVLETLAQRGFSACVLTKSDLVVRDIDLLARMPEASVGLSFAFQNDKDRRLFEARTPSNERRIEALKRLKRAGIETYALICPVMPFITDAEALAVQLEPYVDTLWVYALRMDREASPSWRNVRRILGHRLVEEATEFAQIAFSQGHPYWSELRHQLLELRHRVSVELHVCL